jgi:hypothetical protein
LTIFFSFQAGAGESISPQLLPMTPPKTPVFLPKTPPKLPRSPVKTPPPLQPLRIPAAAAAAAAAAKAEEQKGVLDRPFSRRVRPSVQRQQKVLDFFSKVCCLYI